MDTITTDSSIVKNRQHCPTILNKGSYIHTPTHTNSASSLTIQAYSPHESSAFTLQKSMTELYLAQGVSAEDDTFFQCGTMNKNFPSKQWVVRCGQSSCPICHAHRAHQKTRFYKKAESYFADGFNEIITHMITVTFPDKISSKILRAYEKHQYSFTKLFNSRAFKRIVLGFIKACEVSIADTGKYHIHYHILCLFDKTKPILEVFSKGKKRKKQVLPQATNMTQTEAPFLVALFRKYLGRDASVHIAQRFDKVMLVPFYKYVTKIPSIEPQEWLAWREAIFGKRLITTGGLIRQAMMYAAQSYKRKTCHAS